MGNNDVLTSTVQRKGAQNMGHIRVRTLRRASPVPGIYRVMTVMIMSRERRGIWHLSDVQDSGRSDSRNAEQGTERQNPLRRFNK